MTDRRRRFAARMERLDTAAQERQASLLLVIWRWCAGSPREVPEVVREPRRQRTWVAIGVRLLDE